MEHNIGIIGYGSMGKMMVSNLVESKLIKESDLFIANRTYEKMHDIPKRYPAINICKNNGAVAKNAAMLFLCVKPLEIKTVLTEIINDLPDNCHIISLNGSVLFKHIEHISIHKKVSKIIPSITAEIHKSVTLVCHNKYVENEDKDNLNRLLACLGTIVEVPEAELGIGSELTSCMPGFIAAIFKVIAAEAEKRTSINKETLITMLIETLYGTGTLLLEKEMTFDKVISRVATKGGITEEGPKIIAEKVPKIIDELFEKTLEKRNITTEKAQKEFMM
jgi:pyrroline-5-carboxylate reductase